MMGILPPPSYRHRQPPPSHEPSQSQLQPPPPQQPQQQEHNAILKENTISNLEGGQKYQQENHPRQLQLENRQGTRTNNEDLMHGIKINNKSGNNGGPPCSAPAATSIPSGAASAAGGGEGVGAADGSNPHQSLDLNYMHRPPTILPNYGKRSRGSVLPKSNVSRVLLYDNITQQTMLDVRVNSIRSQSYKTNRELDMHMKSFISRRKVREKALKKITRVEHFDDYVDFVQDHEPPSNCFLPGIATQRHSNKNRLLGTSALSTPLFRSHNNNNNNDNNNDNDHHHQLPRITVSSQSEDKPSRGFKPTTTRPNVDANNSLPRIIVPTTFGEGKESENENDNYNNDLDFDGDNKRSNKVGIQFVKGEKGVTRVFNIVSEETSANVENVESDTKLHRNKSAVKFVDDPTFNSRDKTDENNNSTSQQNNNHNNNNNTLTTTATANEDTPHLKPRKSIFQLQKEKEQDQIQKLQEKDLKLKLSKSHCDIPADLHPEKPIIDSRFLHLRRLLVPQEPPNEGFAELSPSFPKRYPQLKDLSPRSRRKNYAKQLRRKRREEGRVGGMEEGFSGGESDGWTDESDEEEKEEEDEDEEKVEEINFCY